jgi:coenzyme PQQ precursor peptide PqqA
MFKCRCDNLSMNTEAKQAWIKPDFEDVSTSMECTAYAMTLQ